MNMNSIWNLAFEIRLPLGQRIDGKYGVEAPQLSEVKTDNALQSILFLLYSFIIYLFILTQHPSLLDCQFYSQIRKFSFTLFRGATIRFCSKLICFFILLFKFRSSFKKALLALPAKGLHCVTRECRLSGTEDRLEAIQRLNHVSPRYSFFCCPDNLHWPNIKILLQIASLQKKPTPIDTHVFQTTLLGKAFEPLEAKKAFTP